MSWSNSHRSGKVSGFYYMRKSWGISTITRRERLPRGIAFQICNFVFNCN
ncbi:uncharacterized protein DS421_18g615070 [Arachis hypogaea]|nr:uncharacterized protein DS421_18g615070 [Arachis hypogaea]